MIFPTMYKKKTQYCMCLILKSPSKKGQLNSHANRMFAAALYSVLSCVIVFRGAAATKPDKRARLLAGGRGCCNGVQRLRGLFYLIGSQLKTCCRVCEFVLIVQLHAWRTPAIAIYYSRTIRARVIRPQTKEPNNLETIGMCGVMGFGYLHQSSNSRGGYVCCVCVSCGRVSFA